MYFDFFFQLYSLVIIQILNQAHMKRIKKELPIENQVLKHVKNYVIKNSLSEESTKTAYSHEAFKRTTLMDKVIQLLNYFFSISKSFSSFQDLCWK